MAAERFFFVGDWGHPLHKAVPGLPPECSRAERAIGQVIGAYSNRGVAVVSVGDTFYTKPPTSSAEDPTGWIAERLAAAQACLGDAATRGRDWYFVPGNHDEEEPLCGASLPQYLPSADRVARPNEAPPPLGFDWATRYRGQWTDPAAVPAQLRRLDTWWSRRVTGDDGGSVLLIGLDTNCIINAHVQALVAQHGGSGEGQGKGKEAGRLAKPLRHALARRCGYGSGDQGEVASRQAAWLRDTLADQGPRSTAVIVVGHHPLTVVPHDTKGKKAHEVDAMLAWWSKAVPRAAVVDAYVCGHEHNLQVLLRELPAEVPGQVNLPRVLAISGSGGGNDELDAPLLAEAGVQGADGARVATATASFGFIELVLDHPTRRGLAEIRVHKLVDRREHMGAVWTVDVVPVPART